MLYAQASDQFSANLIHGYSNREKKREKQQLHVQKAYIFGILCPETQKREASLYKLIQDNMLLFEQVLERKK